jgi:hypothetical protein
VQPVGQREGQSESLEQYPRASAPSGKPAAKYYCFFFHVYMCVDLLTMKKKMYLRIMNA